MAMAGLGALETGHQDEIKDLEVKVVVVGDTGVGKTSMVQRYVRRLFTAHKQATVGAAFMKRVVALEDWQVVLQIWDTAGQERFRSMAPMYYRGADAAILVYDVTDMSSLKKVEGWVEELRAYANEDLVLCLAGNKSDLLPADFLRDPVAADPGAGGGAGEQAAGGGEDPLQPSLQLQQQQQAPPQAAADGPGGPGSPGRAGRRRFVHPEEARQYAKALGAREFRTSAKTGAEVDVLFDWIAAQLLQMEKQKLQRLQHRGGAGGAADGGGGRPGQGDVKLLQPGAAGAGGGKGRCC